MIDIDTTRSSPFKRIPRTPVDLRPLKTRTSVVEKRIARPELVKSMMSSSSPAMRTLTNSTPSGRSMAILPFDRTLVKSDNALRRTSPADVAKITCKLSQSVSGTSTGIIAAIETPVGIGRIFTIALPFAVRPPNGKRHVFSLYAMPSVVKNNNCVWVFATNSVVTTSSSLVCMPANPLPPRRCARKSAKGVRLI